MKKTYKLIYLTLIYPPMVYKNVIGFDAAKTMAKSIIKKNGGNGIVKIESEKTTWIFSLNDEKISLKRFFNIE